MKALSIRQPWAWAIVAGYKPVENRTWYCGYRGELYIHAGKKIDQFGYAYIKENFPDVPLPLKKFLETGGLIGKVIMTGCVTRHKSKWFGGPYGFVFERPERNVLIPMRGRLGIFNISIQEDLHAVLNAWREDKMKEDKTTSLFEKKTDNA